MYFHICADLYVEKMRFKAVSCMCRSYRPTIPVSYVAQILGFTNITPTNEESEDKDSEGLEECIEWLKLHGASFIADNNGEMQLDAKVFDSIFLLFTWILIIIIVQNMFYGVESENGICKT